MNHWKITTYALSGALLACLSIPLVRSAQAEPQPRMRGALELLESAKQVLEKATPDKGGHRVKAIELTKQAIEEVRAGVRYDNEHRDRDDRK